MKRYHASLIIIICVLVLAFLYTVIVSPINTINLPKDVQNKTYTRYENMFLSYELIQYPSFVNITPLFEDKIMVGITNDPYNLGFGIIPVGGSGRRHVFFSNNESVKSRIKILKYGNISSMIHIDNNDFILDEGSEVETILELSSNQDTKPGEYSGEIDLIIIKPKQKLLEFLLWVV